MSDSKSKFIRYIKRIGAGSMLISIIVHVVIIIGATVWVVSSVQPQRKALFKSGDGGSSEVRHPVKMSNTQPHLDTLTKRLSVDTPASTVSLPDLPTNPGSSLGSPSLNSNPGASGIGAGPSLKAPIMPAFGFREAQDSGTLVGNFYDFKQLSGLKPNPDYKGNINKGLDPGSGAFDYEQIKIFIQGGWSLGSLSKYYQAPTPLYATQIFIPRMNASEAPKAYGVEKEVKSKAWMALYRGKVAPPKDGVYRFVGLADDILLVQFNGTLVLDGSIHNRTGFKSDSSGIKNYGNLVVGKRMELRANQFYDIKIAVSEAPGGIFYAYLLFEQEGVSYKKDAKGAPLLPIFRVADTTTDVTGGQHPDYMENGPVWRALPVPKY